jgi:hypothetical protein
MTIGAKLNRRPAPQTAEASTIPAPTGGIDSRQPAGAMLPENCLYTYNLMPAEWGMLLRFGFRQYNVDVETAPSAGEGVRSIFSFDGTLTGASDDRLFAVTNEGIWDATAYDTPPILKATFADQTLDAGYGIFCHYIDQSGEEFLLYADSVNGLWEYTQSTDLWTRPTGIIGPDINNVSFVVVHKQRLWLIENNSTIGWYLPVASKSGQATEFYFGSKFPHGGKLMGLYNWSVDGGSGLDDILIAIATSGDVIPYQGADPSSADTWSNIGTYFIGKMPRGRRCVTEHGGQIYMLSSFGLMAMEDLLRGVDSQDTSAKSLSYKIAKVIRDRILVTGDEWGWEVKFIPSVGTLIITTPEQVGQQRIQYAMNLITEGWGYWRGVPISCLDDWRGEIYFGTNTNTIEVMDVPRDGMTIIPPDPPALNGEAIKFSMLTSYQRYGKDALFKQVQYIRPDFWSSLPPLYTTKAVYDYTISELTILPQPPLATGALWDVGLWDTAIWGGGEGAGQAALIGSGGLGRTIAVAIRGEASASLRLLSFDIILTAGGPT